MNGHNFTEHVRHTIASAVNEAQRRQHEAVGTEHLLLGLLAESDGVATAVITNCGVDIVLLRQHIEASIKHGFSAAPSDLHPPFTSRAKKVLELAMAEARDLEHTYVGTEHLLLGLLREEIGIAAQVLTHFGVSLDGARAETMRLVGYVMPVPRGSLPARPVAGITIEIRFEDGAVARESFNGIARALNFLAKQL